MKQLYLFVYLLPISLLGQFQGGTGGGSTTQTVQASSTVPLTLLSFTAAPMERGVLLTWETVHEVNTDRFTIERASDGLQFVAIGTLPAAGNSPGSPTMSYSFSDPHPIGGVRYYRLKTTDLDGTLHYSDLVRVHAVPDAGGSNKFILFPNPAKGVSLVTVGTPAGQITESFTVQVYDRLGRQVYSGIENTFRLPALAPGAYLVRVNSASELLFSEILTVRR